MIEKNYYTVKFQGGRRLVQTLDEETARIVATVLEAADEGPVEFWETGTWPLEDGGVGAGARILERGSQSE